MSLIAKYKLNGSNKNDIFEDYDAIISEKCVKTYWSKDNNILYMINFESNNFILLVNNDGYLYCYDKNYNLKWDTENGTDTFNIGIEKKSYPNIINIDNTNSNIYIIYKENTNEDYATIVMYNIFGQIVYTKKLSEYKYSTYENVFSIKGGYYTYTNHNKIYYIKDENNTNITTLNYNGLNNIDISYIIKENDYYYSLVKDYITYNGYRKFPIEYDDEGYPKYFIDYLYKDPDTEEYYTKKYNIEYTIDPDTGEIEITSPNTSELNNLKHYYLFKNNEDGSYCYNIEIDTENDIINDKFFILNNKFYFICDNGYIIEIEENDESFINKNEFKLTEYNIKDFCIKNECLYISTVDNYIYKFNSKFDLEFTYKNDYEINSFVVDNDGFIYIYSNYLLTKLEPSLVISDGIIADKCYEFKGGNSYINIVNPFDKTTDIDKFSITFYFKPTSYDYNYKTIFGGVITSNFDSITYSDYYKTYVMLSGNLNKLSTGNIQDNSVLWNTSYVDNIDYNSTGLIWIKSLRRFLAYYKGSNKYIMSIDSYNWFNRTINSNVYLNNFKYIDELNYGLFLCKNKLLYSSNLDALDDTIEYMNVNVEEHNWIDIAYGDNKFILITDDDSSIYMSEDLVNWETQRISSNEWKAVCYGNGYFVLIPTSGNYIYTYKVDEDLFTRCNLEESCSFKGIKFINNVFYIITDQDYYYYSYFNSSIGSISWGRVFISVNENPYEITDLISDENTNIVACVKDSDVTLLCKNDRWYMDNLGSNNDIAIVIDEDRQLCFILNDVKYDTNFICDSTKLDNWYNLIFTYNDKELKFYVDGVFYNRFEYNKSIKISSDILCIGDINKHPEESINNYFSLYGCINDFRIYDSVLSLKEINDISNICVGKYKTKLNKGISINDSSDYVNEIEDTKELTNSDRFSISFWYKNLTALNKLILDKIDDNDGFSLEYKIDDPNDSTSDYLILKIYNNKYQVFKELKINPNVINNQLLYFKHDDVITEGVHAYNSQDYYDKVFYNIQSFSFKNLNHFCFVYEDNILYIYINGMYFDKILDLEYINSNKVISIYKSNYDIIDDLRIYHNSISTNDIKEIYRKGNILDRENNYYTYSFNEEYNVINNVNINGLTINSDTYTEIQKTETKPLIENLSIKELIETL